MSLGVGRAQNSIITTGVLLSEPDIKIKGFCLAVGSKNANMSVLATHKYYIKEEKTYITDKSSLGKEA